MCIFEVFDKVDTLGVVWCCTVSWSAVEDACL